MGEAGSQAFVAATVVLMAATPVLAPYASRLAERIQAHRDGPAPSDEPDADPSHFADLEHHVIVAGYGSAARHLVRVLDGSGVPFAIVTLSPDGAREAEAEGRRVLRGDYGRLNILQTVGLDRAKLLVVPDDSPHMAHRVVRVARASAPMVQIVACTPTTHDAAELLEAGADRVIAMEREALVGLFGDILEAYQVDGAEILRHEEALRRGNYLAFDASSALAPAVVCDLDDACLGTRVVTVRAGAPVVGRRAADLDLDGLTLDDVERGGRAAGADLTLREGDRLTLRGSAEAFRAAGDLFRATPDAAQESGDPDSGSEPTSDDAPRADWIDLDTPVTFSPREGSGCTHTDQVRNVVPGTQGCAECLRDGTRWVHLRVCMTCGHVGCCDSSEGRHATAHFHETGHAIMRSIEPGEDWGWCYEDEKRL
jgi:CPA2 family monovalent cation:H+ antiporter-2